MARVSELVLEFYKEYAQSVNLSRAIPSALDGLKPVQRRLLLSLSREWEKTATVIGRCMGKYHPHGDSSLHAALINMVQSNLLVEGEGNWGVYGGLKDLPAAAMRYTKCRLSGLGAEFVQLKGAAEQYVNDLDNQEPVGLPTKWPYCLLSGAVGIGVGISYVIPPYRLASVTKLVNWLKSPGFGSPPSLFLESYNGRCEVVSGDPMRDSEFAVRYYLPLEETVAFDGRQALEAVGIAPFVTHRRLLRLPHILGDSVFVRNETDDKPRTVIGKVYRTRGVNLEEIAQTAQRLLTRTVKCRVLAVHNGRVYSLSALDLLEISLEFYFRALHGYCQNKYKALSKKAKAMKYWPAYVKSTIEGAEKPCLDSDLEKEVRSTTPEAYERRGELEEKLRETRQRLSEVTESLENVRSNLVRARGG